MSTSGGPVLQASEYRAAREGLLVADLLDKLLHFRAIGHHLIQAKVPGGLVGRVPHGKGKAVMPEFCFTEDSERAQRTTGRDSGFEP